MKKLSNHNPLLPFIFVLLAACSTPPPVTVLTEIAVTPAQHHMLTPVYTVTPTWTPPPTQMKTPTAAYDSFYAVHYELAPGCVYTFEHQYTGLQIKVQIIDYTYSETAKPSFNSTATVLWWQNDEVGQPQHTIDIGCSADTNSSGCNHGVSDRGLTYGARYKVSVGYMTDYKTSPFQGNLTGRIEIDLSTGFRPEPIEQSCK